MQKSVTFHFDWLYYKLTAGRSKVETRFVIVLIKHLNLWHPPQTTPFTLGYSLFTLSNPARASLLHMSSQHAQDFTVFPSFWYRSIRRLDCSDGLSPLTTSGSILPPSFCLFCL